MGSPAASGDEGSKSLRSSVRSCAERLHHVAELALLAADGTEPEAGARYLLDGVEDSQTDLRVLRTHIGTSK
jgi:hypothetical protein